MLSYVPKALLKNSCPMNKRCFPVEKTPLGCENKIKWAKGNKWANCTNNIGNNQ